MPSRRRLTRRVGRSTPAFIISMSAVPPDSGRTPSAPSSASASRSDRGSANSKGLRPRSSSPILSMLISPRSMFRTLDGARVEYDQHGAGAPLLLIHSLLTELTVFDVVLPRLARQRRVTRINLPGFGASTPIELTSVGNHADHVARAMEALELPRDTAVFGNGFGAFVALELAVRHGARFGRLIVA